MSVKYPVVKLDEQFLQLKSEVRRERKYLQSVFYTGHYVISVKLCLKNTSHHWHPFCHAFSTMKLPML
jgi:hypothetical protein